MVPPATFRHPKATSACSLTRPPGGRTTGQLVVYGYLSANSDTTEFGQRGAPANRGAPTRRPGAGTSQESGSRQPADRCRGAGARDCRVIVVFTPWRRRSSARPSAQPPAHRVAKAPTLLVGGRHVERRASLRGIGFSPRSAQILEPSDHRVSRGLTSSVTAAFRRNTRERRKAAMLIYDWLTEPIHSVRQLDHRSRGNPHDATTGICALGGQTRSKGMHHAF
jgi:hypothetical protein